MSALRQRKPRQRLDSDNYRALRKQVLERDGWRCQSCGAPRYLQVHHLQSRGRLGADRLQNLITLCAQCHRLEHLGMNPPYTQAQRA
jgi:5-methylcytosine-specific restriction endonuclease McrA